MANDLTPKTNVENVVAEVLSKSKTGLDANILYREFIGQSNIEKFGEEEYVIKQVMVGTPIAKIVQFLKAKHPDGTFTYNDFDKFLARHHEIGQYLKEKNDLSARRHLRAKEQCAEALAGLALYTQTLVKEFRQEGDNTNTVAAIRALNTTLENYMKLEGFVGNEDNKPTVNIVNAFSERKSGLRDRVHNANFVDAKVVKDK